MKKQQIQQHIRINLLNKTYFFIHIPRYLFLKKRSTNTKLTLFPGVHIIRWI